MRMCGTRFRFLLESVSFFSFRFDELDAMIRVFVSMYVLILILSWTCYILSLCDVLSTLMWAAFRCSELDELDALSLLPAEGIRDPIRLSTCPEAVVLRHIDFRILWYQSCIDSYLLWLFSKTELLTWSLGYLSAHSQLIDELNDDCRLHQEINTKCSSAALVCKKNCFFHFVIWEVSKNNSFSTCLILTCLSAFLSRFHFTSLSFTRVGEFQRSIFDVMDHV